MKKVVNSVLASALALTVAPMVVGAEEATKAPAMDPALEKVVKRLEALGLVAGYGNNDFGVERSITRAEFATLVVRARGLEEGAKLAQFQSNFADVKSSDWFSGFVNVASGQEIVKGYTDKSFKPQNQVTYAEAVAMIIRALGYEPAVRGVWPNNYIAKASELGIARSISTPDKAATRGDVFKMLDNSLRVDLMKQVEYGTDIRFEERKDETLLTEYLGVTVRDMEWANESENDSEDLPFVTNVPVVGLGDLKANEVTLDGRASDLGNSSSVFTVADGINPNAFAGQHVQVWVKDDKDTIVWMEGSEDEEVLATSTDTIYLEGKIQDDGSKITKDNIGKLEFLLGDGKKYSFAEDVAVTYNFKRFGRTNAADGLKLIADSNGAVVVTVKVVLDEKGDIAYISAVDEATADKNTDLKYGSEVIEKLDADKKKITNLEEGSFDLKDKEEGEDFLVFLNGAPAKLADLKPLDVYSVYYADGDEDKPLVFATRNVVEGKVEKVEIRTSGDNRLKIGDKTYRSRNASYSENANKDIEKVTNDELRDLDGEEIKIYLDASGRVRHIETKDSIDDRKFKAIVTKEVVYDTSDDKYNFTVFSEKGSKVTVSLEAGDIKDENGDDIDEDLIEDTFVPSKDQDSLVLVEVTLDSKGEVNEVQLLDTSNLEELSGPDWDDAADEDGNTLNVTEDGKKKSYDVTDDTVVFDMTGDIEGTKRLELDDARVAKFSNLADDDDATVYYLTEGNDVEAIFVVEGDGVESDTQYGYVKNYSKSGDDTITVMAKVGSEVKEETYKLDGDAEDLFNDVNRLDFISFSLNSENEVIIDDVVKIMDGASEDKKIVDLMDQEDIEDADLDRLTVARVDKVEDNTITFTAKDTNGDEVDYEYLTNTNTVFFNTDFEVLDSVEEGDYIVLVETDDDSQRYDYVLVVTDEDEVEDDELQAEATKFLTQSDEDVAVDSGPGPDDVLVESKVTAEEKTIVASSVAYVVKGAAGTVDNAKLSKLTYKLGTETGEITVKADGSFEFATTILYDAGTYNSIELTAENTDGKNETKSFNF